MIGVDLAGSPQDMAFYLSVMSRVEQMAEEGCGKGERPRMTGSWRALPAPPSGSGVLYLRYTFLHDDAKMAIVSLTTRGSKNMAEEGCGPGKEEGFKQRERPRTTGRRRALSAPPLGSRFCICGTHSHMMMQ